MFGQVVVQECRCCLNWGMDGRWNSGQCGAGTVKAVCQPDIVPILKLNYIRRKVVILVWNGFLAVKLNQMRFAGVKTVPHFFNIINQKLK